MKFAASLKEKKKRIAFDLCVREYVSFGEKKNESWKTNLKARKTGLTLPARFVKLYASRNLSVKLKRVHVYINTRVRSFLLFFFIYGADRNGRAHAIKRTFSHYPFHTQLLTLLLALTSWKTKIVVTNAYLYSIFIWFLYPFLKFRFRAFRNDRASHFFYIASLLNDDNNIRRIIRW